MSKIANRLLLIPNGVLVQKDGNFLIIEGPKGPIKQEIPSLVDVSIKENIISTEFVNNVEAKNKAIVGTINSLIFNMIKGVTEGYQKKLDIKGVGYKASLNNRVLDFSLGYSHSVLLSVPSKLEVDCINNTQLIIKGVNKQEVGWFAAKIRDFRRPNVFVKSYKGIFYAGETIKIKSGKRENKK